MNWTFEKNIGLDLNFTYDLKVCSIDSPQDKNTLHTTHKPDSLKFLNYFHLNDVKIIITLFS